ncbi:MAG: hypothetical protein ACR65R_13520 [Methylomicrobium sp.]
MNIAVAGMAEIDDRQIVFGRQPVEPCNQVGNRSHRDGQVFVDFFGAILRKAGGSALRVCQCVSTSSVLAAIGISSRPLLQADAATLACWRHGAARGQGNAVFIASVDDADDLLMRARKHDRLRKEMAVAVVIAIGPAVFRFG